MQWFVGIGKGIYPVRSPEEAKKLVKKLGPLDLWRKDGDRDYLHYEGRIEEGCQKTQ